MSAKCLLAAIVIAMFGQVALADVVVIVHPSNNAELTSKKVQRIFLGKEKKFSDGKETIPINQNSDASVRGSFDSSVLGRNTNQVSAYWSKLVFTGKGIPPKEVDSDAAVIEIVANNPNAIGYVAASADIGSVKKVTLN